MIKSTYDVVVVGAGPAGCSAAIHLHKYGIDDVLLIDKALFPRDKICGDGIPLKCNSLLEELGINANNVKEHGYKITQLNVYTPKNEIISYGNPQDNSSQKSVCLARKEFDLLLQNQAKQIIGNIYQGTKIRKITSSPGKHHTLLLEENTTRSQKQVQAKLVIGADGSNSVIARQNKMISNKKSDRFIGLRGYCYNEDYEPAIHIIYDKNILPGYIWLFPVSKNKANIGMVVNFDYKQQTGKDIIEIFKQIVISHPVFNKIKAPHKNELFDNLKGFPLNLGSAKGSRVTDGLILVGDAASFINPLTGGGIYNALLSGKMAATVAADCLRKKDLSAKALKTYDTLWKKELHSSFYYSSLIRRAFRYRTLATWYLQSCSKNRIFANVFLATYGNPLPRFGPFNPLFWLKVFSM